MKSLSKMRSSTLNTALESWKVSDLDIELNVLPEKNQAKEILALIGAGQKNSSGRVRGGSPLVIRPKAADSLLSPWSPGELALETEENETQQPWEFVDPSRDFFEVPEQQILQEKLEVEKERIELIRQARSQAEKILQGARTEADKIILSAHDEIEHAKQNGYQTAYKEMQAGLAAVHAMLEEVRHWQSSLTESGEKILMEMLKEIAQTMFGEGVHLDAEALQVNLNRIMESAQRLGDLNIFLNTDDASLLDPSWSSYQLLITGNQVRIIPSEKILPGGCFIKGSTGIVDARVETQLSAVLNMINEVSESIG